MRGLVRFALWLFLLAPAALMAQTQTTVTGNLSGIGTVGSDLLQARITLINCGAANPVIPGVTNTVATTLVLTANSSGLITSPIWGNDLINCNGLTSTAYAVQYLRNNVPVGVVAYYRVVGSSPTNLTTATPIVTLPPTGSLLAGYTCPPGFLMQGFSAAFAAVCTVGIAGPTGPTGPAGGLANLAPAVDALIPYTDIDAFGDSYMVGYGGDTLDASGGFLSQLNRDVPGNRHPYGLGGTWTADIASIAWQNWPGARSYQTHLVAYDGGNNNARYSGSLVTGLENQAYLDETSGVAHISIPLAQQQMSSAASCSSGWSGVVGIAAFTLNPNVIGTLQQSTTNGNSCTYVLPAGANVVYWWGIANTSAATFTVAVNGTLQTNFCTGTTTFNSFGCNGSLVGGADVAGYAIVAQVFPGSTTLPNNTIVVTVTSATGAGNTVYDVGAATVPTTFNTVVGIMGDPVEYANSNPAASTYNTVVQAAAANLQAHGFSNVFFSDVRNGVAAGSSYPAARALNDTTDFSTTNSACPGGFPPQHGNSCWYAAMEKIFLSSAAAAGFPYGVNNTGPGNTLNAPWINNTGGSPFATDFSFDAKMAPYELSSNTSRGGGFCFGGGSFATGDLNSKCNSHFAFEYFPNINLFGQKVLLEGNNYTFGICGNSPGGLIGADTCNTGFFTGTLGSFFNQPVHMGTSGNWLTGYPTQGTNFAYTIESEAQATGTVHNATFEYLPTGTTGYNIPACNNTINGAGHWIQYVIKDNADTGSFTFNPNPTYGDKLNGSTSSITFTNVPQNTMWTLRCTLAGSPNTNIFMQETIPTPPTLGAAASHGASITINTQSCTLDGSCTLPAVLLATTLTTTGATTDTVTLTGVTATSKCSVDPTNTSALAATQAGATAKAANSLTITHAATAGMTYDILCTPN